MRSNEQRLQSAIRFHQNLLRSRVMSPADTADVQFTIDVLSSQLQVAQPAQVTKSIVKSEPKVSTNGYASFNNMDLFVVFVSLRKLWYSMANQQDNPIYDAYIAMCTEVETEMKRRGININE